MTPTITKRKQQPWRVFFCPRCHGRWPVAHDETLIEERCPSCRCKGVDVTPKG